jgi:oligopeptide/dipeptide ABC transporter ATP-binding protein
MSEPLVIVEHLSKAYPSHRARGSVRAVSDVSFVINSRDTLGLVGESGSGKTTVGRCLLKFIEPDRGRLTFEGIDITAMPEKSFRKLRSRVQMVFQEPYHSLNPRMTIFDTVAEPLRIHSGLFTRLIRDRVHELIREVRLDERHLRRYPHQLSLGQQQRVGIARAIATNPSFLVLDEPTSALDPSIRADVIDLLLSIQSVHTMTYLYISHDLSAVRYMCNRVAVMYLGSLVEFGTTEQIFEQPLHPYTRALLSAALASDPKMKRPRYALTSRIVVPSMARRGCPLHSRCPEVRPQCEVESQTLADVGEGHRVACWRVHELGT